MRPADARRFVVVRHDNLGDVALALPMAGLLKRTVPGASVAFAVRGYARDVAGASRHVDAVLAFSTPAEFEAALRAWRPDAVIHAFPSRALARAAARAGVPLRVGTARRWWHWVWCNLRPRVRRQGSTAHEAQLNLRLLAPFVADVDVPLEAVWPLAGLAPAGADDAATDGTAAPKPDAAIADWPLKAGVANVLLQVRSNGHGKEWPIGHYEALARALPPDRFNLIVNGTPAEGDAMRADAPGLFALPQVTDATRGFPIAALMRALPRMDAVLSNSTGPMHLGALSGAPTLGLFVDAPVIGPSRWGPLGPHARTILAPREGCTGCGPGERCACMAAIPPGTVADALREMVVRR